MASTVRNSVKRFIEVTPSANDFDLGPCHGIYLTSDALVSGVTGGGDTVTTVLFPSLTLLPISFSRITAVSAGTCYACYAGS